jgi:hypothetical protein
MLNPFSVYPTNEVSVSGAYGGSRYTKSFGSTIVSDLLKSLRQFDGFYVIHRKNEKNHIHFTIHSSRSISDIKQIIKNYFQTLKISIDNVFLTEYQETFGKNTLQYLLRKGNHSNKHDLIDWGLVQYTH